MSGGPKVNVTPRDRRASWAQAATEHDPPYEASRAVATPGAIMRPDVQRMCERIEKLADDLLEAMRDAHRRWHVGDLTANERAAMQAAADVVRSKIGPKP